MNSVLSGKKVLVGVSASIAAYKAAILVRLLIKAGAEVKVVMTPASTDFITPLTLSTLSKNPVLSEFAGAEGNWNNHVELGLWADLMIIAPASANSIGKMAGGLCDNLLLATYLSAKCPVYFAPAMDLDMYKHSSTKDNLKKLQGYGNYLIPAGTGELASGLEGEGRMAEPEEIIEFISNELEKRLPLKNKKALVTAGPTYEAIDPVRFIGNHSTGKMGFAIAERLAEMGADVTLVTGPTALVAKNKKINQINITSAGEMLREVLNKFESSDVSILSAAVADYTPEEVSATKIKKKENEISLTLKPTKDILAELGKQKKKHQLLVGFALETDNEIENAKSKLQKKSLDLIVLNSLKDKGAGFGHNTNKVTIIDRNNKLTSFELKSKQEVAKDIVASVIDLLP